MSILVPNRAQMAMLSFMGAHPGAFICAEPGLGKTGATLSYIHALLSYGHDTGALVVAPKNVSVLSWPDELAKWAQFAGLKVSMLRNGLDEWNAGSADVYITNYEQLPKLGTTKAPCSTVIFDESWKAKNPSSKLIKSFRKNQIHQFARRVALNGTPRPNRLEELFAQVRLLDGGKRLGAKFKHHIDEFYDVVRRPGMQRPIITPKPGAAEAVYARIADITLIQRQEDYLDLVPMKVEDVFVTLPPDARKMYDEMEADFLTQMRSGDTILAFDKASSMNKLRQITSGAVYDEDRGVHVIHDVKVKAVRQLMCLGNLLIFTDFIHERDRVAALPGVKVFQPSMVKAWNAGEVKCMTAHCRSVGAGLNLQGGGSLGAWVTMPYSPLEYFQANSRLHRTGQTEPVTIYRIIAEDTIDEAIAEVLRRKSAEQSKMMTSEVFADTDAVASVLSSMRRRRG